MDPPELGPRADDCPTLVRTKGIGNSANDQGSGGGLGNHGTLTIRDPVIARNKVDFEAGGGIDNGGTLTLIDSVVRSNVVRLSDPEPGWGSGGGIENGGNLELIGSTVTRNTSADEGGGIYNWQVDGIVSLDGDSSVTGNVPDDCVGTLACQERGRHEADASNGPVPVVSALGAALPAQLATGGRIGGFGRGERHSPATTDLPITMRLAEPPEPFDWLRSA